MTKLYNLNDQTNLNLNEVLQPGELSFLIQPEKPSLLTRIVPLFGEK